MFEELTEVFEKLKDSIQELIKAMDESLGDIVRGSCDIFSELNNMYRDQQEVSARKNFRNFVSKRCGCKRNPPILYSYIPVFKRNMPYQKRNYQL